MDGVNDDDDDAREPSLGDYEAALRLSRIHLYDGHEPYAPAVMRIAAMLAAYRREVARDVLRREP